jgi:hypothetical protein
MDVLLAALLGVGFLSIYIRTLAPSLLWGDSAEFQTLSYTLGMTHPSGYMTHIMIGKLFTYLPLGNVAYRVNLVSAFFGALAVAQVYLIVRLSGGIPMAGVSACLMLGLIPLFWRNALVAESYAPAAGMITTIWLLFLCWRNTGKWQYLFLSGLAGGLSVGIHSTVVMTAAAVLVVMLLTARKRMEWAGAVAGALLGLLITILFFLFLDRHNPPSSIYNTAFFSILHSADGSFSGDFDTPLKRFLAIFPAGHFWEYYFSASDAETERRLIEYVSLHPIWALGLSLAGAFAWFKFNWRHAIYPLISFLIIWSFAVTVSFSIYQEFYTPLAVFVFVWYGFGASKIFEAVSHLLSQKPIALRSAQILMSAALIVLPLWQFHADLISGIRFGYTTFVRRDHIYPVFAPDKAIRDALKVVNNVPANAIVFTDWDKLYSYVYTAHIEERETGMSFHLALLGDDIHLSEATLAYINEQIDKRPIYFAIPLPELTEYFQVEQINESLFRVYRK